MDKTTLVAADAVTPDQLHDAVVQAFSDYLIGPFALTLGQFPAFLARQSVDLPSSRVALQDGQIRAVALTSLRPAIARWRLATLCAVLPARGTGVARLLLDDFISRAGASGASAVELECIAQNERAVRLYRQYGFETVCELHGWSATAEQRASKTNGSRSLRLRDVDVASGFAWLRAAVLQRENLPLQVTAESLRAIARPLQFWQCGQAQMVFSIVPGTPIQIHSLIDLQAEQLDAEALVQQLCIAHPHHEIEAVPQVHRADLGGIALQRLGFTVRTIHQFLMVRLL